MTGLFIMAGHIPIWPLQIDTHRFVQLIYPWFRTRHLIEQSFSDALKTGNYLMIMSCPPRNRPGDVVPLTTTKIYWV